MKATKNRSLKYIVYETRQKYYELSTIYEYVTKIIDDYIGCYI